MGQAPHNLGAATRKVHEVRTSHPPLFAVQAKIESEKKKRITTRKVFFYLRSGSREMYHMWLGLLSEFHKNGLGNLNVKLKNKIKEANKLKIKNQKSKITNQK